MEKIDLTISGVPDDEELKTNILRNAENEIIIYYRNQVNQEFADQVEPAVQEKVADFQTANNIKVGKIEVEPVDIIPGTLKINP